MNFLKNINKEFNLSTDFDLLNHVYYLKGFKQDAIIKVNDINMHGVKFKISSFNNLDAAADFVANSLITKLLRDVDDWNICVSKVIDCWVNNPNSFVKTDTKSKTVFTNMNILTSKEYSAYPRINFDKISIHSTGAFSTGYGIFTYLSEDDLRSKILELNEWTLCNLKNLKSSDFKRRIKNYIQNITFNLSFNEVINHVTIIDDIKLNNGVNDKPDFPLILNGYFLNKFLSEFDDCVIDDELILYVKNVYDIDISCLHNWEISQEHVGFHDNDAQMCDYIVTFMSPKGLKYNAYNTHSLMTGWDFCKNVEIK